MDIRLIVRPLRLLAVLSVTILSLNTVGVGTALGQCGIRSWLQGPDMPEIAGHSITYDTLRNRVISFGGANYTYGQFLQETWAFDGADWTLIVTPHSPPGSEEWRNIAYDSTRDRVVKFGGFSTPTNYETWEFDGVDWSRRALIGPPVTHGFTLEYDAAHQKTVLFGGIDNNGTSYNQTWLWNGSFWLRAFPLHNPAARNEHAMVYDSERHRIVMYGGYAADVTTRLNDLWEWNGTDWTQITLPNGPTEPLAGGMAYDSLRHYSHLCGNTLAGSEDWTYDGSTWTRLTLPASFCEMGGAAFQTLYMPSIDKILSCFASQSIQSYPSRSYFFQPLVAPVCFANPVDLDVGVGGTIELAAQFSCTPNTTYRWYRNNVPVNNSAGTSGSVSGATSSYLVITGNQTTVARSGQYKCIATSPCGVTSSGEATVTVDCTPRDTEYDIDPSPATFDIDTPFGPITVNVMLLGRLTLHTDPACGTSPMPIVSVGAMDLRTEPAVVTDTNVFGGTVTVANARLRFDSVLGDPGIPNALQTYTPWERRFTQNQIEPAFAGTIDYNTLGYVGTYDMANVPPTLLDVTGSITPNEPYRLNIPFIGAFPIDLGLPEGLITLTVHTTLHANIAPPCLPDIGTIGGVPGHDGALDNNDFIVYIDYFFNGNPAADIGTIGGVPGVDGVFDNNDFIVYIDYFFNGC